MIESEQLCRRIIPCCEFTFSGFNYLEINEGEERNPLDYQQ